MPFDGSAWNNSIPTNSDLANEIDDYMRDIKIAVQARMAKEHVWPASQATTNEGGYHNFITFQQQSSAPTMAGTTGGAIYVDTNKNLMFEDSAGALYMLIKSSAGLTILGGTATIGSVLVITSGGAIVPVAVGSSGQVLTSIGITSVAAFAALPSTAANVVVPSATNQIIQYDSGVSIATNSSVTVTFATQFANANYGLSFAWGPASFDDHGMRVTAKVAGSFTTTVAGNGGTFAWIAVGSKA